MFCYIASNLSLESKDGQCNKRGNEMLLEKNHFLTSDHNLFDFYFSSTIKKLLELVSKCYHNKISSFY